jgi:hypothetical protein
MLLALFGEKWYEVKLQPDFCKRHKCTSVISRKFKSRPAYTPVDVLLLDCTYKTSRFNIPLLNICAITSNNMVIQVGLAFLSGEKESDYNWAIDYLRDIIAREHD